MKPPPRRSAPVPSEVLEQRQAAVSGVAHSAEFERRYLAELEAAPERLSWDEFKEKAANVDNSVEEAQVQAAARFRRELDKARAAMLEPRAERKKHKRKHKKEGRSERSKDRKRRRRERAASSESEDSESGHSSRAHHRRKADESSIRASEATDENRRE